MSLPVVTVVGGGMITHDQILPSLWQLQRQGAIGEISVCALNGKPLRELAASATLRRAFPGFEFTPYPAFDDDRPQPDLFREVIRRMPARNVVVVAVPDQFHYDVIRQALAANQHVVCVKPLVLKHDQAVEVEREAHARGLFVGVEYHKRFDDRSLIVRRRYRDGRFGEFKLGTAALLEKWYYRHSNFQNWCTAENSDAFAYIGCHYVDLVHFITGLLPVSVSVYGLRDNYPNGREGFLWTDARVLWNNGACLNVQNALGFPDDGPGSNIQGITMYCATADKGTWIRHDDQYRGMQYVYSAASGDPGSTVYHEPSTDYFQYLDVGEAGMTPVGYGLRSVDALVRAAIRVEQAGSLADQQRTLKEIDDAGVLATPANSRYNELVMEAGRLSILNGGREAVIRYEPVPTVELRQY
jgi:predicted dehydrogenase